MLEAHTSWGIIILVVLVFGLWRTKQASSQRRRLPLPPSPPSYPIIGNVFDLPTRDMHIAYRDMNAKYGTLSRTFNSILA